MPKVLVVEDEASIAADLSKLLSLNGWTVETAFNGTDGLQLLRQFSYDLVLLDWCLPGTTGFDICKQYRASGGSIPIIFITGQSDISFKESGLDAGSDDYITKPFDERELMARVRTVMRRPRTIADIQDLQLGACKLDAKKRTISDGTKSAQLTALEYSLMEYLVRHKNQSFNTAQLFEAVWLSDTESSEETVRVHIRVLRRKLELAGLPPLINHRRGFGYSVSDTE